MSNNHLSPSHQLHPDPLNTPRHQSLPIVNNDINQPTAFPSHKGPHKLQRSNSYPRLHLPSLNTAHTVGPTSTYKTTQISNDQYVHSEPVTAQTTHGSADVFSQSPSYNGVTPPNYNDTTCINRHNRTFTYVDSPQFHGSQLGDTNNDTDTQNGYNTNNNQLYDINEKQASNVPPSRYLSPLTGTTPITSPALRGRPPIHNRTRASSRAAPAFMRQNSLDSSDNDKRSNSSNNGSNKPQYRTVFTAQPDRSSFSPSATPQPAARKLGLQRAPTAGPFASGATPPFTSVNTRPLAISSPAGARYLSTNNNNNAQPQNNQHQRNQSFFLDVDELQRGSTGDVTNDNSPSGLQQRKMSRAISSGLNLAADDAPYVPAEKSTLFSSPRGMAFLQRSDDVDSGDLNAISLFSRARRGAQIDEISSQLPQVDHIINPFNKQDTREFIKELGAALFAVGLPLHMVEFYVTLGAHRLGEQVQTFSVTTAMWLRFNDEEFCRLVAPATVALSLGKITDIASATEDLLSGLLGPKDGLALIHSIVARPSHWPAYYVIPAVSLLSAAGAVAFGGGGAEMLVALISGFLLGLLQYTSPGHITLTRGLDLVSAVVATVVAIITNAYIQPIYVFPAVFGGIIWSIPGLRVTLAMNDLSMGNTVTGVAKLMSGIITIINLGVGIIAGLDLNKVIKAELVYTAPTQILSYAFIYGAVLISAFPTMILLDAKPTHFLQLSAGYIGGFAVSSFAATYIGSEFGTWLAAFVVGVAGNLYGRITVNPAIEMWLFSIIMLVPGSLGVKSILSTNNQSTISLFTQMIGIAVAIVTGLFTANFAVPPKRAI